jgi:periplasmic protein TonB
MSMTSTMLGFVDYGAAELKRLYQMHVRKAFLFSVIGHSLAVAIYLGIVWYNSRDEMAVGTIRVIKYSDLGPPPSITNQAAAPQIQVAQAAARPTIGIPEPVPDAEVSSETTIATQTEMSQMTSLVGGETTGEGSVIQVEQPVSKQDNIVVEEEKLPEVGEFVPVEEQPAPVEQPKPVYPEIARRAGIEGTVWIMILVDRTGKVRDVRVTKGPEMFHEAAKEAAWKSVWRPAIQNQKPVPVWVTYPIRFTLKG